MPRAVACLADGDQRPVFDTLLLGHQQRRSPNGIHRGLRGSHIEVALAKGARLLHDDRLLLDDGGVVEVVAQAEPLLEVRAGDHALLARAAWLLGDHHIAAELSERRLRVLRNEAVVALLKPLGVRLIEIDAPFEPEGGAYDHAGHAHDRSGA